MLRRAIKKRVKELGEWYWMAEDLEFIFQYGSREELEKVLEKTESHRFVSEIINCVLSDIKKRVEYQRLNYQYNNIHPNFKKIFDEAIDILIEKGGYHHLKDHRRMRNDLNKIEKWEKLLPERKIKNIFNYNKSSYGMPEYDPYADVYLQPEFHDEEEGERPKITKNDVIVYADWYVTPRNYTTNIYHYGIKYKDKDIYINEEIYEDIISYFKMT